jgi:hypothetical protein
MQAAARRTRGDQDWGAPAPEERARFDKTFEVRGELFHEVLTDTNAPV